MSILDPRVWHFCLCGCGKVVDNQCPLVNEQGYAKWKWPIYKIFTTKTLCFSMISIAITVYWRVDPVFTANIPWQGNWLEVDGCGRATNLPPSRPGLPMSLRPLSQFEGLATTVWSVGWFNVWVLSSIYIYILNRNGWLWWWWWWWWCCWWWWWSISIVSTCVIFMSSGMWAQDLRSTYVLSLVRTLAHEVSPRPQGPHLKSIMFHEVPLVYPSCSMPQQWQMTSFRDFIWASPGWRWRQVGSLRSLASCPRGVQIWDSILKCSSPERILRPGFSVTIGMYLMKGGLDMLRNDGLWAFCWTLGIPKLRGLTTLTYFNNHHHQRQGKHGQFGSEAAWSSDDFEAPEVRTLPASLSFAHGHGLCQWTLAQWRRLRWTHGGCRKQRWSPADISFYNIPGLVN